MNCALGQLARERRVFKAERFARRDFRREEPFERAAGFSRLRTLARDRFGSGSSASGRRFPCDAKGKS